MLFYKLISQICHLLCLGPTLSDESKEPTGNLCPTSLHCPPKSLFVLLAVQGQGKTMLPRFHPGLAQISKLWRGLEDEEIKPMAVLYCCSLRKQRTLTYSYYLTCLLPQIFRAAPVVAVSPLHRQHLKISLAIRYKPCNCPCVIPAFLRCSSYFPRLIAQRIKWDRSVHAVDVPECLHIQRHESPASSFLY